MAMHFGALKTITFFQNKDPTFIVSIVPLLKPLKAQAGEIIFEEGDSPSEVFFIIEGRVNFCMDQVIFKTIDNGNYFGEIDMLFNRPRGHTAQAEIATELLSLERNKFIEIMN